MMRYAKTTVLQRQQESFIGVALQNFDKFVALSQRICLRKKWHNKVKPEWAFALLKS